MPVRWLGWAVGSSAGWVEARLRPLSGVFAVEVVDYAVMSNHLHVVLRMRADVAARWRGSYHPLERRLDGEDVVSLLLDTRGEDCP